MIQTVVNVHVRMFRSAVGIVQYKCSCQDLLFVDGLKMISSLS